MEHDSFPSEFDAVPGRMVNFCPMCDAEFNPLMARVIQEHSNGTVVHVRCSNCRNALIALMHHGSHGVNSFGFISDMSAEDYLRVRHAKPLSADDVIDMHVRLRSGATFTKAITQYQK